MSRSGERASRAAKQTIFPKKPDRVSNQSLNFDYPCMVITIILEPPGGCYCKTVCSFDRAYLYLNLLE